MHPAQEYIEGVLNDEITTCKYIKWAVERHVNDLKKSEDEDYPYYFDEQTAAWYIDLFQFFILYEGEVAGRPFDLSDLKWIQFQLWCIFGWKRKTNDYRRFRKAYILVARKNIKTTVAACMGLIGLMFDRESGAQVYSAASNAKQAKICFRIAQEIARKSPALRNRLNVLAHNISYSKTASFFEYISSQSAQTKDGLNPQFSIIDEYHAHPDNEVHDVLDSATAARNQPLVYIISTEGYNQDGPHAMLRDYCIRVIDPDDDLEDDSIFFLYFTLDEDDDWEDEEVWEKSNPALDVSVKRDDLRAKAKTAKQMPSTRTTFLTKHMNVAVHAKEVFLPSEKWGACGKREQPPLMHNLMEVLEDYKGRKAYGGLDMGDVSDFTSLEIAFEPIEEKGRWDVLSLFWIPEDTIEDRKNEMLIAEWVRNGWIATTPGDYTDHRFIRHTIEEVAEVIDFAELAYDRYKMSEMVTQLMEKDINMVPFGQGFVSMSPAVDTIELTVMKKGIEHFKNPVLSWMNRNVAIKRDPAGNRKFDKDKSTDKIDGMVSLAMALHRGMINQDETSSVYDDRGIVTI